MLVFDVFLNINKQLYMVIVSEDQGNRKLTRCVIKGGFIYSMTLYNFIYIYTLLYNRIQLDLPIDCQKERVL
jgi:hypothetical protein